MKTLTLLASAAALCLVACADKPPAVDNAEAEIPRNETVFDSQLEVLEQAKALDQQMKDAEERHKKEMRENGM